MTYTAARARLQGFGREIGYYHQESQGATAPAALQGHISDGFCAGAAVDWLRSVLHGGNAGQGPDVVTAGISFVSQLTSERQDFYDSLNERFNAARRQGLAKLNEDIAAVNQRAQPIIDSKVEQLAEQKMQQRLPGITQSEMDAIVDEVQAALRRKLRELEAQHDQKFTALSQDQKFQAFWREFGRKMDEKLAKRFGEHRYSNLTVARASASKRYGPPNGVKQLIEAVLAEQTFSLSTGVLLGLSPASGDVTGHAIGIHRMNTGNYEMFDPNFGTYRMNRGTLLQALCWLFVDAYPDIEDGTSDNKDYEIDGMVQGEYVIYAPGQR